MRVFLLMICILSCRPAVSSPATDSLLSKLKLELAKQPYYDRQKEGRIATLRSTYQNLGTHDTNQQFDLCLKLYDEYKSYKYDSAYVYAARLTAIGQKEHNTIKVNYSKIKLGFILLSAGKYKEAFNIIEKINHSGFNEFAMQDYYSVMIRANSDLAGYDHDAVYSPGYKHHANLYLDSAILLSKPASYSQLFLTGYRHFINGNNQQAIKAFFDLNRRYTPATHEDAITASLLSELYIRTNEPEKATDYLIKAVIADLRASTKETLAIFRLAELASKKGDVENAYLYIRSALNDAEFYGARQRQVQIGAVLPLIAAQKLSFIESQKKRFLIYLFSTLALMLCIIVISVLLYKQLKHSKLKEAIIRQNNARLEAMNNELMLVNKQVLKANRRFAEDAHIKEEYIGYFFAMISGYILKLEKLKNAIEARIIQHKPDQIQHIINEIQVHKEREAMYQTFDKVFLKIFPNFITSYNSLFKKEDQVWPKEHEILTTDMRIFALNRLGIHDNETISRILQYTAKTVYVYKMRVKARSIFNADEFDERLMNIKAVEVLVKTEMDEVHS